MKSSKACKELGQIHEVAGYEYVRTGPDGGWTMSPDIYARCPKCGFMMSLDWRVSETCTCSNLHKDADAGRFGANTGDASIALYRKVTTA